MKKVILFLCLPAFLIFFAGAIVLNSGVGKNQTPIPFDHDLDVDPDFRAFLMEFEPQQLPFKVGANDLLNRLKHSMQSHKYEQPDKILSRNYSKFLPLHGNRALFSRMPEYIVPLQRFENEQVIAVVYALERGFSRMYHTQYIATFDRQGQPLGTHLFLQFTPEKIISVQMNNHFVARQHTYQVNWAANDVAYHENTIVGLQLLAVADIPTTLKSEDPSLKNPIIIEEPAIDLPQEPEVRTE